MSFVLDASVTMAWFLAGEATPYTEAMLSRIRGDGAIAPMVWPLEVANAFLIAERRQRVAVAQTVRSLDLLSELPITVETMPAATVWEAVLALARSHGLSVYDASYVELAMRQGLPLATLDDRMRTAATQVGVGLAAHPDH